MEGIRTKWNDCNRKCGGGVCGGGYHEGGGGVEDVMQNRLWRYWGL